MDLYCIWSGSGEEMEGAAVRCVYCRRNLVGHALACLLLRVWSGCGLGLGRGGLSFFWVRTVESVGGADGKEARPGEASASARVRKDSERVQGDGGKVQGWLLLYADETREFTLSKKVPDVYWTRRLRPLGTACN
jgi:hypothetical protein